jgi:type IV secretory pathway VirB2 component (pilin)
MHRLTMMMPEMVMDMGAIMNLKVRTNTKLVMSITTQIATMIAVDIIMSTGITWMRGMWASMNMSMETNIQNVPDMEDPITHCRDGS